MFDLDNGHAITFTPSIEAKGHYVTEKASWDRYGSKFGPMPAEMVQLFIAERKQVYLAEAQSRRLHASFRS